MDVTAYFSTYNHNLSTHSRIDAMNFIVEENISADHFFDVIYQTDEKRKIVYYHVLDMIVENNPDYLNESLDFFIEKGLVETHESLKRCISRTLYHQLKHNGNVYSNTQKEQIIHTMFDWIITHSWVATRVNAIHVLFFLIDEADWIKEQLIAVIEQNMFLQEPSFVSRGKKILKLVAKRKS